MKRILIALMSLFLISCQSTPSKTSYNAGQKEQLKKNHLELAQAYTKKNQYDKAMDHYLQLLKVLPNDSDGFYGIGEIYENVREYKKAYFTYVKALKLTPKHYNASMALGRLNIKRKKPELTIKYLKPLTSTALVSQRPDFNILYGKALYLTNQKPKAKAAFSKLPKQSAWMCPTRVFVAKEDLRKGNTQTIIKYFPWIQKNCESTSSYANALYLSSLAHAKTKNLTTAKMRFFALKNLYPQNPLTQRLEYRLFNASQTAGNQNNLKSTKPTLNSTSGKIPQS